MNYGPRTGTILTIDETDFAAMGAGNLLRKSEPYSAALGLCGVKRHEEIFSVGDTEAAVFDADHETRLSNTPSDAHRLGAVGKRCVYGVGEQIDKHLF